MIKKNEPLVERLKSSGPRMQPDDTLVILW